MNRASIIRTKAQLVPGEKRFPRKGQSKKLGGNPSRGGLETEPKGATVKVEELGTGRDHWILPAPWDNFYVSIRNTKKGWIRGGSVKTQSQKRVWEWWQLIF